jgi:hypothetical protein
MKKRYIKETTFFSKEKDRLISKRMLLLEDFIEFKKDLVENPDQGDMITGTGGVRKTRLKSASGGKSGGFRICYLDIPHKNKLYLMFIYPKSERENISASDKKDFKELVKYIKEYENE